MFISSVKKRQSQLAWASMIMKNRKKLDAQQIISWLQLKRVKKAMLRP